MWLSTSDRVSSILELAQLLPPVVQDQFFLEQVQLFCGFSTSQPCSGTVLAFLRFRITSHVVQYQVFCDTEPATRRNRAEAVHTFYSKHALRD
jgi:hypothetical protein